MTEKNDLEATNFWWLHGSPKITQQMYGFMDKKKPSFIYENIKEVRQCFSNHTENAKNFEIENKNYPKAKIITSEKHFNPNIIIEKPEFYSAKLRNILDLGSNDVRYLEINDEMCHENFRAAQYNLVIPLKIGEPIDLKNSDFESFEETMADGSIQNSWRPKIDLVMKRQPIRIAFKKNYIAPSDFFVEKFLGQIFVSDRLASKILEFGLKDVFLQDPTYQKHDSTIVRIKTTNGTDLIDLKSY